MRLIEDNLAALDCGAGTGLRLFRAVQYEDTEIDRRENHDAKRRKPPDPLG